MQDWFNIEKSFSTILHINKIKKKKYIMSTDVEKSFDTIHDPFMIKCLSKMGIEETSSIIQKAAFKNIPANIIPNH